MGTIIGIDFGTCSVSGTITGGVGVSTGVGEGLEFGINDGAQGVFRCRMFATDYIVIIVVSR